VKNKSQETDGYGRDKRPKTEKLKRKEKRKNDNLKTRNKSETEKKSRKVVRVYVKSVRRGARCLFEK